jgi:mannose-6-phosphate isomerase-like protein (cupin superfamily)
MLAALVLLALAGVLIVRARTRPVAGTPDLPPPATAVLADWVRARAAATRLETDDELPLYASDTARVAVTLLGPGQTIPLHIDGDARVVLPITGATSLRGTLGSWAALPPLLSLPLRAPYATRNTGAEVSSFLAFTRPIAGAFRFVPDGTDGPAPAPIDLAPDWAHFLAGADRPPPTLPLDGLRWWPLRAEATLPAAPGLDTVLVVLAGTGELVQAGHSSPLSPTTAVVFHRAAAVDVRPVSPLSLLVFEVPAPVSTPRAPTPDPWPEHPLAAAERLDLPALVERVAPPGANDVVATLYASPVASVHVHAIGVGERTPLHLHRRSGEATLVLTGAAEVTQAWGEAGRVTLRSAQIAAPTLVISPPGCGHAWVNVTEARQLNVVFASPAFDENFYVDADDPRLGSAPAPARWDPEAALADTRGPTVTPVALDGTLSAVVLPAGASITLPARADRDAVLLGVRGEAGARGGGLSGTASIGAGSAVVLRRSEPLSLTAVGPTALLLFEPPASAQAVVGGHR